MNDVSSTVQKNHDAVQRRIAAACERCGRDPRDVRLVAVTKYAEWEWVQGLAKCCQAFGENRPQQLAERSTNLPTADWHLIGQLQRNKAKLAVQHSTMIHSVDSKKLLDRVSVVSMELQRETHVLLQVNVSGEQSKSGFQPGDLLTEWDNLQKTANVTIHGFMTMAPATKNEEIIRKVFGGLRNIRDEIRSSHNAALPELSMGMSGDFEIAIEEGATLVRIGRLLFDGLSVDDR